MLASEELDPRLDEFIVAMPKAELHVHLEGSVHPSTLRALAAQHGIELPIPEDADVNDLYRFRDFDDFIAIFVAISECLRAPDDFARVVVEYGAEAARQNVRYAELHFNPEPHSRRRGIPFPDLLAGMNAGRDEVRRRWGVELRWIADGIRDAESGIDSVMRTVEWIAPLDAGAGVVALGLGGSEVGHPPAPFADAFATARDAGLHVVAHAGETTGPETIWATLRELGAERIGHGISAIHDPSLVAELAGTGIPLEVCPISNLRTGVVASPETHPVGALDAAGVVVTIGSDDPPMFGTTLTDEYRFLARHHGYRATDLARLSLNAVRAAFLPPEDKARLLTDCERELDALRFRLGLED